MINPEIELEFIDGDLKGESVIFKKNLVYQMRTEMKTGTIPEVKSEFKLGSSKDMDYIFLNKKSRKYQCSIEFSSLWGWCIKDDLYHWDKSKNFIYLANYKQFCEQKPSNVIKLFKGMNFIIGNNILKLDVKNINPSKISDDIYDSDTSLFFEEDAENHRNL